MRTCPFPDCYAELPDKLFACARHWHSIPFRLRVRVQEAYEAYMESVINVEQLRAIQNSVMQEMKVEPMSSLCRSCKAKIRFAKTANGSQIPLDFEPNPAGNMIIDEEGIARVIPKADLFNQRETGQVFMPHHATCPSAALYRKAGKKK